MSPLTKIITGIRNALWALMQFGSGHSGHIEAVPNGQHSMKLKAKLWGRDYTITVEEAR